VERAKGNFWVVIVAVIVVAVVVVIVRVIVVVIVVVLQTEQTMCLMRSCFGTSQMLLLKRNERNCLRSIWMRLENQACLRRLPSDYED